MLLIRVVGSQHELSRAVKYVGTGANIDSKHFYRKPEEKIDPLALRPRDAAAALGISPSTLDRLTKAGKIPHVKVNRLVLYRVDSLQQWLRDQEEVGHATQGH